MTDLQSGEDKVQAPEPAKDQLAEPPRKKNNQKLPVRRILLIGFAFIAGFVVLGFLTIQVWEWSNSVEFCANMCHDVHPEEIPAYQDSYHARVKCTECHMGRVGTIENIFLKASHFRHLPEVLLDNYDRPTESESLRPPNESCELCHWPPAFHGDTVREIIHFQPDRDNTLLRTYLILKTGAGDPSEMEGYAIHWHVAFPVEYVALDEHHQEIAWVRTTLPDGRTVEYTDVTNPAPEFDETEIQAMDCVDCHNRVGHPFDSPAELTDEALAIGALSRGLPYAKQEMADLLSAAHASQEAALEAVGAVKAGYEAKHPEIAQSMQQEIEQAEALAQQLLTRLVFDKPGVTWRDFPDESGHADFPGCFRCHDGKHVSEDGEPIRLHCNICHSIPVTVGEADRAPDMPVTTIPEPASHLEANFMADHRFQADDSCITCHGDIEFGTDSSTFCSNYSCHGRAWPEVELDAAFPHPIPLEGKHAEVWCHDCHEGVRKPEFQCANCHEPPPDHFGPVCEDCHTVAGFDQAEVGEGFVHPVALEGAHAQASCEACHAGDQEIDFVCANCHQPPPDHYGPTCEGCHTPEGFDQVEVGEGFVHPVPLEGAHAEATCEACHAGDEEIDFVCANCHQPPPDHYGPTCEECHTPTAFAQATLPPELHPIPLIGAHARALCAGCHVQEGVTPEYVCENCHERPENHLEGACDVCHNPTGWAASAARFVRIASQIPHDVEGREDCLLCHDPAGDIQPAPGAHEDYINEQCLLCHKVAEE
ncbi:MAG: NapC/NirT family cytochrome c [Anaerolineae bacterium]|nr:NapC/NirT family cytochrome c [Anaerolineae bacterium]